MDASQTLSRCELLRDFTDTGLLILASVAESRVFPAGTAIFTEGTVGEALLVVARGTVRLSMRGPDGKDVALGTLAEGEHFGELSLVAPGSLRLVTASADTEVEVVSIRQRDFARLQVQKPQACLKLVLAIAASFSTRLGENRELLAAMLAAATRR